jgi:hypothetical protein
LLSEVAHHQNLGERAMHDAAYFREQAELYFELARRMSVPSDAEYFRGTAERHLASAREIESHADRAPRTKRSWEARRDASPFART